MGTISCRITFTANLCTILPKPLFTLKGLNVMNFLISCWNKLFYKVSVEMHFSGIAINQQNKAHILRNSGNNHRMHWCVFEDSRTAPLTSKVAFYIFNKYRHRILLIWCIYSPFFPLQNAVCFIILTCLVPVLFTFYIQCVLKFKK